MAINNQERDAFLDHFIETVAIPEPSALPIFDVGGLIEACPTLEFRVHLGGGVLSHHLTQPRIQHLGLALAGFPDDLKDGGIYLFGKSELRFLKQRKSKGAHSFLETVLKSDIGCFIVPDLAESEDNRLAFLVQTKKHQVPVLLTTCCREIVEAQVSRVLEEELSPSRCIHGNLVIYRGFGLLLVGKSGIGKSDCALNMLTNGHQLVADDVVMIRRNLLGQVIGKSKQLIRHHMNIRGIGIVNIKELFSVFSVLDEHSVDLVIYLKEWKNSGMRHFEQIQSVDILGIPTPLIHLPVSNGRNWLSLIEVAVRNFILKSKEGYNAEEHLSDILDSLLQDNPV